ncbi:MAG: hypothetical protein R3Y24_05310 [Eubacteriales bacterium]
MFVGNKGMIIRECDRRNMVRKVCNGYVDHTTFFRDIRGDLLISGYVAKNVLLLGEMITEYARKDDLPTIVLSTHTELFENLRERRHAGVIDRIMISDSMERNYHPFYGMTEHQLLYFINLIAEEQGYHLLMDKVLQYASATLRIIATTYPISLPALCHLLQQDDDFISSYALQNGLSNVIADTIRANHEAGIILRRICEKLESVFEGVYVTGADTKYNFQSGAQGNVSVMAFDCLSTDPRIMNAYLKEELFFTLKRNVKVRVVVDEIDFYSENDELLKFLFKMKRQGKLELIFVSQNVMESVHDMQLSFSNVILGEHEEPVMTEELSKALWGSYLHNYPVPVIGKPPALLFTLKSTIQWQIATEERPKVRAIDLYPRQGLFMNGSDFLALKTATNEKIHLILSEKFIPTELQFLISGQDFC